MANRPTFAALPSSTALIALLGTPTLCVGDGDGPMDVVFVQFVDSAKGLDGTLADIGDPPPPVHRNPW